MRRAGNCRHSNSMRARYGISADLYHVVMSHALNCESEQRTCTHMDRGSLNLFSASTSD